MYQRRWPGAAGQAHSRPWVLVEDATDALRVSEFRRFDDAGLDVALCSGPDESAPCPLLRGGRCDLAEHADVIQFALDLRHPTSKQLLREHARQHPDTPVVVQRRDALATVGGQLHALWQAICNTRLSDRASTGRG